MPRRKKSRPDPADSPPASAPGPSTSVDVATLLAQQIQENPGLRDQILGHLDLIPGTATGVVAGPEQPGTHQSRPQKRRRSTNRDERSPTPIPRSQRGKRPTRTNTHPDSDSSVPSSSGESESESDSDAPEHSQDIDIFSNLSMPEISEKMKKKIWSKNYVDLAKLYYGPNQDNIEINVTKSKHETVKSVRRAPQKSITSIMSWCRAFQLYSSIYTLKYPAEAPSMFQYMTLIQSLAFKFTNWSIYDVKFRGIRAQRNLPWGSLHTATYLYVSLANTKPTKPQHQNTSRTTNTNKTQNKQLFRDGYCWTFQKHGKCKKSNCAHVHKCSFCQGKHAGQSCSNSNSRHQSNMQSTNNNASDSKHSTATANPN